MSSSDAHNDIHPGRTLCVVNQKGGVGKTTTAVSLAAGFRIAGKSTVLVDMDPQCNATTALGVSPGTEHGIIAEQPIIESMVAVSDLGLSVVPGSRSFVDADRLANAAGSESRRVRTHLQTLAAEHQFTVVDCPPSVGALTQVALSASSEVLIPIQCEYFAMEGLTQLIQTIKKVIIDTRGQLTFGGIVLTMYDPSLELTAEVESEVRDFFGEIVYQSVVPRDVSLSEAPSHGQTVFQYAPRSRGAFAYTQLCMEVLQRD
ncbi:MAG: ParA family protein [Planctomycetota bacterium]